ncbi:hypothetical protein [Sulfuriferula plumbiphila]|nr:hypothetical protein [Sulfuriferula plumbiphila]
MTSGMMRKLIIFKESKNESAAFPQEPGRRFAATCTQLFFTVEPSDDPR